jgi:hypothetical protein
MRTVGSSDLWRRIQHSDTFRSLAASLTQRSGFSLDGAGAMLFVVEGSRDSTGFSPRRIALFLAAATSRTVYPRKYAGRRGTSAKCNSNLMSRGSEPYCPSIIRVKGKPHFYGSTIFFACQLEQVLRSCFRRQKGRRISPRFASAVIILAVRQQAMRPHTASVSGRASGLDNLDEGADW